MKFLLLSCSRLQGRHTGDNVVGEFEDIVCAYGIYTKIIAVVTENYVDERLHNNELTIKHISCFAHTLQLCVSDGIKGCRRLQNLLAKAGKIVAHVRKSTIVIEKLEEEFRKVLIAKKLFLDYNTLCYWVYLLSLIFCIYTKT